MLRVVYIDLLANVNFTKILYKVFVRLCSTVNTAGSVTTKISFSTNFRLTFIALNFIRIPPTGNICMYIASWAWSSVVVKALRYKSEGAGIDSRCRRDFSHGI